MANTNGEKSNEIHGSLNYKSKDGKFDGSLDAKRSKNSNGVSRSASATGTYKVNEHSTLSSSGSVKSTPDGRSNTFFSQLDYKADKFTGSLDIKHTKDTNGIKTNSAGISAQFNPNDKFGASLGGRISNINGKRNVGLETKLTYNLDDKNKAYASFIKDQTNNNNILGFGGSYESKNGKLSATGDFSFSKNSQNINGQINFLPTTNTQISANGMYTKLNNEKDWRYGIKAQHQFNDKWSGSLEVGKSSKNGLEYSAGVNYDLGKNSHLSLTAGKSADKGGYVGAGFKWDF
ncbi:sericin 1 precursor, putative [Entamoeba histolytica HM-1:IMSS-B]|nr:sericin 1 precursor, putative [Entamoeba histolytica KU27]EMH73185.1 sericin 1 precursor, putative [Entamoeba histolytica HM-1:IMSS-B]ENY65364.1 sericin 1 precursor, putative [Entamoeba histolytica HM-1:IMSS-A]